MAPMAADLPRDWALLPESISAGQSPLWEIFRGTMLPGSTCKIA